MLYRFEIEDRFDTIFLEKYVFVSQTKHTQ